MWSFSIITAEHHWLCLWASMPVRFGSLTPGWDRARGDHRYWPWSINTPQGIIFRTEYSVVLLYSEYKILEYKVRTCTRLKSPDCSRKTRLVAEAHQIPTQWAKQTLHSSLAVRGTLAVCATGRTPTLLNKMINSKFLSLRGLFAR